MNPSKDIFVIGVTGTKGKTTTIELINAGLKKAGYKTALNSSLRRKIAENSVYNKGNSMPGRFFLQRFLREAVRASCKFAIIEVTSEGIAQHRHAGIDFDAVVFLNLRPEHIESHGSFEKYKEAKLNLFKHLAKSRASKNKLFFVNKDDEYSKDFVKAAGESGKIIPFSKSSIKSRLMGEFNKYNIGAAEAVLRVLGVPDEKIKNAILNFHGVEGRMELVLSKPFKVYIDYAHTPDSLEAVYQTLYKLKANSSKLICVLGSAGGGRDKWKRPIFGKLAAEYCEEIILTNEDPFDESPEKILEEIESGIKASKSYKLKAISFLKILDRREAIKKAVSLVKDADTIVITGKGAERFMRFANGRKIEWSDKDVTLEILKEAGL